jgi:bifunctional N-acetylglucosamine-1-phosphate-uridyltransferase/glucosamine-1-phosphate-acetyltransferase GlmU-like protein
MINNGVGACLVGGATASLICISYVAGSRNQESVGHVMVGKTDNLANPVEVGDGRQASMGSGTPVEKAGIDQAIRIPG